MFSQCQNSRQTPAKDYFINSAFDIRCFLIHAHSNVTDMTWGVLDMPSHMTGALFVLFQFAAVISIFAICAAVDFIRIITIGRIENIPLLINVCDKVQNKVSGLFTALIKD